MPAKGNIPPPKTLLQSNQHGEPLCSLNNSPTAKKNSQKKINPIILKKRLMIFKKKLVLGLSPNS